jgi:hypothetical protein
MSQENTKSTDDSNSNSQAQNASGQDSSSPEDQALMTIPQDDPKGKLEDVIRDLPEPKRQEVRAVLSEVTASFMGVVERGGPRIDPETARILTESSDKDNENKFRFLTQKQKDLAEQEKREHDFAVRRWDSQVKILWFILVPVVLVCVGGIVEGIYLATHGHDTLGVSILSAIITGIFAYLAGLGTTNFFKNEK